MIVKSQSELDLGVRETCFELSNIFSIKTLYLMETAVNIIWVSVDSGDGQKLRHLISNRFEEGAELFHQKNEVGYKTMFAFCSIISYLLLVQVNISKIINVYYNALYT